MSIYNPDLLNQIESNNVVHSYYSLRWYMLLMCQEFSIDDTLRLWDTLFAADAYSESLETQQTIKY